MTELPAKKYINELCILTRFDLSLDRSYLIKRILPIYWSDNDEPIIYYFNEYPIRLEELNILKLYQVEYDILKGENRKEFLDLLKKHNNIDSLEINKIKTIPDCLKIEESFKKSIEDLWIRYEEKIVPILERIKYPNKGMIKNIRLCKELVSIERLEKSIKNLCDSPTKKYFESKIQEYKEKNIFPIKKRKCNMIS